MKDPFRTPMVFPMLEWRLGDKRIPWHTRSISSPETGPRGKNVPFPLKADSTDPRMIENRHRTKLPCRMNG